MGKMVDDLDRDGDGSVDFDEFMAMMTGKMGDKDQREQLLEGFALYDEDETGKISFANLQRVAKELGEGMCDEELQEMIDEADRDGDGEINEEEFLSMMKEVGMWGKKEIVSVWKRLFDVQFDYLTLSWFMIISQGCECVQLPDRGGSAAEAQERDLPDHVALCSVTAEVSRKDIVIHGAAKPRSD